MIKNFLLKRLKLIIIFLIIIFNYSCQEKTSGSSGSSNSNSSSSTTLLNASYARDGYYKLTGLVAGSYTYTMGSGTLYSKIEWKGNGVVRRTNMC